MDIREHGSGNAGTTNAFRTFGKKAGALYPAWGLPEMCDRDRDRPDDLWQIHEQYSSTADTLWGIRLYSGT